MSWKIPAPLPFGWKPRPIDSAKITVTRLPDGRLEQRIEHAPLPGVTAEMALWYLEHIDQQLTFRGTRALAYRFWHPIDHIHFKRQRKFGAGDRWHIVEAFQARRRWLLEGFFEVRRVDERGFEMDLRVAGVTVASMDEQWRPSPEGLRWTVIQTLGSTRPVVSAICRMVLRLKLEMMQAGWHRHNVEEAGYLPHFLPELYEARAR